MADERLEKLRQRRARLDKQIALEQRRARDTKRKKDAHEKILIGSVVLAHARRHHETMETLRVLVRHAELLKPDDREALLARLDALDDEPAGWRPTDAAVG